MRNDVFWGFCPGPEGPGDCRLRCSYPHGRGPMKHTSVVSLASEKAFVAGRALAAAGNPTGRARRALFSAALPGALLLGMLDAVPAFGQCSNCPPGSVVEAEPQCAAPDVVNGGCNSTPPAF